MKQTARTVIKHIARLLADDARVHSAFLTGSQAHGTATALSDIDLWIVLHEESGLNAFIREVPQYFLSAGKISGWYRCTEHHYFVTFSSGIQVDLNLVSAATYFSLGSTGKRTMLVDQRLAAVPKAPSQAAVYRNEIEHLLHVGYTTLGRAVSKYTKADYFVVLRFLDAVRQSSILPLLPFTESERIPNAVTLNVERLSPRVRTPFVKTFGQPTAAGCRTALLSCLDLLDYLSDTLDVTSQRTWSDRITRALKGAVV